MLLDGQKRYLGCIGNRRILIDSVGAEHTLTLLHNLRFSPPQAYKGGRRCAESDHNFVSFVVYSYVQ